MAKINKHGLSRDIPPDVKQAVRNRDGFGCIICGSAIYDYEHIDPEFKDAIEHRAEGIVLLCPNHHRGKRRSISVEQIRRAALAPKALEQGFAFESFDPGLEHPVITVGGVTGTNVDTILQVQDRPIIWIREPEAPGAPYRISAIFWDAHGYPILSIIDNEIRSHPRNWDVEVRGNLLRIRSGPGQIVFQMRTDPGSGFTIERMDISYAGYRFRAIEGGPLWVDHPSGVRTEISGAEMDKVEYLVLVSGQEFVIGRAGRRAPSGLCKSGATVTHLPKGKGKKNAPPAPASFRPHAPRVGEWLSQQRKE
ncbi:MAG: HNH endonuclease signature motif containing protein [Pseudomonadota bacterium]|uniref:HNH endonuclease n=1 Tax=Phenylobacterium sp. TaxID=1871053 RepID=UPI0025F4B120|nr:HNH endonuclease signature motif containing protein [Phenylobacterium sp.]MBT9472096.1 HNH endonuclease [Phenylobacterium sp.]